MGNGITSHTGPHVPKKNVTIYSIQIHVIISDNTSQKEITNPVRLILSHFVFKVFEDSLTNNKSF